MPSEINIGISLINDDPQAEHVKKWLKLFIMHSVVSSILKENLHYQKHSHATKLVDCRYHVDLVYVLGEVAERQKCKPWIHCLSVLFCFTPYRETSQRWCIMIAIVLAMTGVYPSRSGGNVRKYWILTTPCHMMTTTQIITAETRRGGMMY